MNAETQASNSEGLERCGGCKRLLPQNRLGHMPWFPIGALKVLFWSPVLPDATKQLEKEGSLLYCRQCRWSQTIGAVFLCGMGLTAIAFVVLNRLGFMK